MRPKGFYKLNFIAPNRDSGLDVHVYILTPSYTTINMGMQELDPPFSGIYQANINLTENGDYVFLCYSPTHEAVSSVYVNDNLAVTSDLTDIKKFLMNNQEVTLDGKMIHYEDNGTDIFKEYDLLTPEGTAAGYNYRGVRKEVV